MILPSASDGTFQFEAAPFTAIGYMWVKTSHWWPNQNVTKVAFASALCDITPSRRGYSLRAEAGLRAPRHAVIPRREMYQIAVQA